MVVPMTTESKACSQCNQSKSASEFYKRTGRPGGLSSACKACLRSNRTAKGRTEYMKRYDAEKAAKIREWLWAEKSKPCERCGNTYHPVAMQFDHLPGFEKKFNVNRSGAALPALKAERAKCQLLCANCHHIVTWERKTGNKVPI